MTRKKWLSWGKEAERLILTRSKRVGYLSYMINSTISLARVIRKDYDNRISWKLAMDVAYELLMNLEKRSEDATGES